MKFTVLSRKSTIFRETFMIFESNPSFLVQNNAPSHAIRSSPQQCSAAVAPVPASRERERERERDLSIACMYIHSRQQKNTYLQTDRRSPSLGSNLNLQSRERSINTGMYIQRRQNISPRETLQFQNTPPETCTAAPDYYNFFNSKSGFVQLEIRIRSIEN